MTKAHSLRGVRLDYRLVARFQSPRLLPWLVRVGESTIGNRHGQLNSQERRVLGRED